MENPNGHGSDPRQMHAMMVLIFGFAATMFALATWQVAAHWPSSQQVAQNFAAAKALLP